MPHFPAMVLIELFINLGSLHIPKNLRKHVDQQISRIVSVNNFATSKEVVERKVADTVRMMIVHGIFVFTFVYLGCKSLLKLIG